VKVTASTAASGSVPFPVVEGVFPMPVLCGCEEEKEDEDEGMRCLCVCVRVCVCGRIGFFFERSRGHGLSLSHVTASRRANLPRIK